MRWLAKALTPASCTWATLGSFCAVVHSSGGGGVDGGGGGAPCSSQLKAPHSRHSWHVSLAAADVAVAAACYCLD